MDKYEKYSRIFYAYTFVTEFATNELVGVQFPPVETVFNTCAYLLQFIELATIPPGISFVKILHSLSNIAYELGAKSIAKDALFRLRDDFSLTHQLRDELAHKVMLTEVSKTHCIETF